MNSQNPSILVVGSATRDIFIDCSASIASITTNHVPFLQLEEGTKIDVTSITEAWGGGAINAALCFSAMGAHVSTFFARGDDHFGSLIIKELTAQKIDCSSALCVPGTRTAVSFILTAPSGNNPILNFRGANERLSLQPLIKLLNSSNYQGIYIAPLSGPCGKELKELIDLKKDDQIILHNPSIHQLETYTETLINALPKIDVILLNKKEAETLFARLNHHQCPVKKQRLKGALSKHFGSAQCSIHCFFQAMKFLGASTLIVTNGKEGVYASSPEGPLFVPSEKIELANAVGAGDTFGATVLTSLIQKDPFPVALKKAVSQSAYLLSQKKRPGHYAQL